MSREGAAKPSGSRPTGGPKVEDTKTVITFTMAEEDNGKKVKAALPTPFLGDRKETKQFILEASPRDNKTSRRSEQQLEQDIAKAEARRRGQLTQSISNPGGRVIPPLTRASRKELLTPLHSPSLTSQQLTETPAEDPETRRTSTPSFIPIGSRTIEPEEEPLPNTPKPSDSDTLNISTDSPEELDPFQRLLQGLKNSPRSPKVQTGMMAEDKKLSGSRPRREEPVAEEAVIGSAMPVQVVSAVKEVKAALPRAFTGTWKDAKKFLREVLIYVALNPKAFLDDRSKKLFLLSYMTDKPGEFWKNKKTDLLLAYDADAEKVTWSEFLDDFRTSFEPLDPALKAQLELKDLKMKERADEYTYQFTYLAKQTGYNDAAQIVAFKRGLPKSLVFKIMTRLEGAPSTIKEWMNAAIIFDESYKQALEYGKTWDDEHGGKKPQRSFRKKEKVAIKQIGEVDWKEYMAKGLCFRCGRAGHRIKDCPDAPKKDERKPEEPKKLTKEERFVKIRALVNEQPKEDKDFLLDLMEQEGF
uniref:CCHC-type domain-containing protein n=1 Tax=Moniliophthora roreri TaxID=221103 RepID=A0A0W0FL92_MONRR